MLFRLREYPIAKLQKSELSVFRCLHYLDWHCKTIYLVDENGKYMGLALTKEDIAAGWEQNDGDISWQAKPVRVGYIPEIVIKEYIQEQQKGYVTELLGKFPRQEEFPVLDKYGRIISVVAKQEERLRIDWKEVLLPKELQESQIIYVTSLGSDNLLGFYRQYRYKINLEVLSESNLNEALKNGMIIYEVDGLPQCKKVNLPEVVKHNEMMKQDQERREIEERERKEKEEKDKKHTKEIGKILPCVHVANQWASIKENEFHDMSQLIEKFDEGYFTVSITDAENNFKYFISQEQFKDDFPNKELRKKSNFYITWQADEKALKRDLAEYFWADKSRKEVPILCAGKIIALGRFAGYFDLDGNWDSRQAYVYDWNWIDEAVAKEFFQNRRKILLSSEQGCLKGFIERFSLWLDITVYKDEILPDCLAGKYDIMFYGVYNYDSFRMDKWDAHLIYITLLQETVRRWLATQGVAFYFFAWDPNPPSINDRCDKKGEHIGGIQGGLRDGVVPYFVADGSAYDKVLNEEELFPNFHSGRRVVTKETSYKGNGIYFYGPCNIVGSATYSPYKTIESYLQERLNKEGLGYRVYNYGTEGLGSIFINWLYRIMDTPFTCGDIVIVFGSYWYFHVRNISHRFPPLQIYKAEQPFFESENKEKKCFYEPNIAHMNTMGYEIISGYIKKIIEKDLRVVYKSPHKKISFLSTRKLAALNPESRLGTYLEKMPPSVSREDSIIGGVIIKNIMTKEDCVHMVQECLNRCDKLYVFVPNIKDASLKIDIKSIIGDSCPKGTVEFLLYDMMERQTYAFDFKVGIFISGKVRQDFDPVDDTYTFARYIAPRMGISKYFTYEEPEGSRQHAYNCIRQDMLTEEGIEYIEIPRLKDVAYQTDFQGHS